MRAALALAISLVLVASPVRGDDKPPPPKREAKRPPPPPSPPYQGGARLHGGAGCSSSRCP